jgi:hypothetical protein
VGTTVTWVDAFAELHVSVNCVIWSMGPTFETLPPVADDVTAIGKPDIGAFDARVQDDGKLLPDQLNWSVASFRTRIDVGANESIDALGVSKQLPPVSVYPELHELQFPIAP